jgi:hypothetical protein
VVTPLLSTFFAARYGEGLGWRLSLAVAGVIVIAGGALWWWVEPAKDLGDLERDLPYA